MPRWALAGIASLALAAVAVPAAAGSSTGGPTARPAIVGGGKANAAGWSFTVALEQKRKFICGGSLVASAKVLTAAHCVKHGKRRNLSVLAGTPWISGKRKAPRFKVRRVIVDPKYNGRKDSRDFAVLTLADAPGIEPIRLPSARESAATTKPGRTVRSAGWGYRSAFGLHVAQRLKATRERVYAARKCQRTYAKPLFQGRAMICTLGRRVGRFGGAPIHATTCNGDSGGPLVANTPDGPRLVGVTSGGVFPCGLGGASIYARVASRLSFIRRAIQAP
jgi:trypsin